MFKSLFEAAQNSTFKSPFTSVNCQAATPAPSCPVLPSAVDGPSRQLSPNHNFAAAAVAQGGKNWIGLDIVSMDSLYFSFDFFRLLRIRLQSLFRAMRSGRYYLLRYYPHHGGAIGFS